MKLFFCGDTSQWYEEGGDHNADECGADHDEMEIDGSSAPQMIASLLNVVIRSHKEICEGNVDTAHLDLGDTYFVVTGLSIPTED